MIYLDIRDLFIFFSLEFCDPCDKDWKKQLEFVIYLDIRDLFIFFPLSFVIRLTCDKDWKKRLESVICLIIRDLFIFFFSLSFVIRVIKIGRNNSSL